MGWGSLEDRIKDVYRRYLDHDEMVMVLDPQARQDILTLFEYVRILEERVLRLEAALLLWTRGGQS